MIRTVTHHYTGKLIAVTDTDLVLSDAAWIADTGRFHDALKSGLPEAAEIEPFTNDVIVQRTGIIDSTVYPHELPKEQR